MNKVAVFGKPGSGKSTLAKKLAAASGISLYPLDALVYEKSGALVEREVFDAKHDEILAGDRWIVEGFGPIESFYKRLEAADTLIYIDLSYAASYYFVTKRLLKGLCVRPEGWPEGSSVFKGSLQSYKFLKLSPKFWNQAFLERLEQGATGKKLYRIQSVAELDRFVESYSELKHSGCA